MKTKNYDALFSLNKAILYLGHFFGFFVSLVLSFDQENILISILKAYFVYYALISVFLISICFSFDYWISKKLENNSWKFFKVCFLHTFFCKKYKNW